MFNGENKSTILILDPDVSFTDVISSRLDSVGFNVLVANSEEMAIKLLFASSIDVILLDHVMKGPEGQSILAFIKSNGNFANIPIIILSSDLDVNSKVYGFLTGANDYIVKPFKFAEVLARINTQLRILNMQKELENKNKELLEKNLLLEQLAITDSLTGMYNRSYVLDRLNSEVLRSSRYKEPISFLMIDIDYFKKINDSFGHLAGDAVLKVVATKLKNSVRDVDIIGRYGGEEFIVVCPNTEMLGARIIAERIRLNALNSNLMIGDKEIKISVSIGISSSIPKIQGTVDSFITKQIGDADVALYRAKASGRNRVETYDSLSSVSDEQVIKTSTDLFEKSNLKNEEKFAH